MSQNHESPANNGKISEGLNTLNPAHTLLLSCYEMGHQPLSLAWPLAALNRVGIQATAVDLAVADFPTQAATQARFVGIAVPMHTALRLGMETVHRIRAANPQVHICFYGLYAWLNADFLLQHGVDSVIAGESEKALADLVCALANDQQPESVDGVSTATVQDTPVIERLTFPVPMRAGLPPLDQYAHYTFNGNAHVAGYTEASRGCLHTCRHCPVVPVYSGRFFVVPVETVLADIEQQVAAGARHMTFGDPDFLNGPGHALKVARALHEQFPDLTFDFTTKVEHILQHRSLFPELRRLGASFVISAFEAVSNVVLAHLEKGHTVADMVKAVAILGQAGLAIQPTWVAFTPWTTLDDYVDLLAWIRSQRLVAHVPAVQLAVRLLIPPNSALLNQPETAGWLGELDAANFTYHWDHPDPRMDELHRIVTRLAEQSDSDDPCAGFQAIEQAAYRLAGRAAPKWVGNEFILPPPPRLTEDWFC